MPTSGSGVSPRPGVFQTRIRKPLHRRVRPRTVPGVRHDFLVAFSCKGRGVCPSCNARRMTEIAAHLVDQVFQSLPVRQWGEE